MTGLVAHTHTQAGIPWVCLGARNRGTCLEPGGIRSRCLSHLSGLLTTGVTELLTPLGSAQPPCGGNLLQPLVSMILSF